MQLKLVEKFKKLLDEILELTNTAFEMVESANWEGFTEITTKRGGLIEQLKETRELMNEKIANNDFQIDKDKLDVEIAAKIKNITKVDAKILDIVSREKNKISKNVNLANQGKAFLKKYKNRVNSQKTVYKTI